MNEIINDKKKGRMNERKKEKKKGIYFHNTYNLDVVLINIVL